MGKCSKCGQKVSFWSRDLFKGTCPKCQGGGAKKSWLGRSVLIGSASLALAGAINPKPPDFNIATGVIYGFLLGALFGVIVDRVRRYHT